MSWLARSIANTLSLNDDDSDDDVPNLNHNSSNAQTDPKPSSDEQETSGTSLSSPRGVKEDLSELTKTLTSQFWGVASFLAPPPETEPYKPLNQIDDGKPRQNSDHDQSESVNIGGIRSDFAEIGGRFKSGITKLSTNINVTEITKMASNFLQLGSEDEEGYSSDSAKGAIGVTEQAVAFARDIAMHPETWLDFPLPENELEEDFYMSDAQQEHALAVERLAPSLAALRIELCPGYMSEGCFWKIYFVLLHPTLGKEDAELLSTPQVMQARGLFAEGLQNRAKAKVDNESGEVSVDSKENSSFHHEESLSLPSVPPSEADSQKISVPESAPSGAAADSSQVVSKKIPIPESTTSAASNDSSKDVPEANSTVAAGSETEKHPLTSTEIQIVDKPVVEVEQINHPNRDSGPSSTWEYKDEDDGDDWLKEEPSEVGGVSGTNTIPIENEEDVSFSDLEEDDEDAPTSSKTSNYTSDKDSREWVQL